MNPGAIHPNLQVNQLYVQQHQAQNIQQGNQAVVQQPQINPLPNPRLERGRLFCE
jgi:predicted oxidoreductase